jgi:hypothetical protein
MATIAKIQMKMKEFDTFARNTVHTKSPEDALQAKWKELFGIDLANNSAKSFTNYYRSMSSRQSGGAFSQLTPAALEYTMSPGLNPGAYGRFPVAIDTDVQSIRDLDVYFQNSLTSRCGAENSSLTIPEGMGSNHVGGASRKNSRKSSRKNRRGVGSCSRKNVMRKNVMRKSSRKNVMRKSSRKNVMRKNVMRKDRRNTRRQNGGLLGVADNLTTSLTTRPYLASVPVGVLQSVGAAASGSTQQVPTSGNPTTHTWHYQNKGVDGLVQPSNVAYIADNFDKFASPAPWQTQA